MGDELVYWPAAQQLAAGESVGEDGYSPLWPRGYLWFLAFLVRLFGNSVLAMEVVQTVLLLAAAWMIRRLAARWTGSAVAGDVAGCFAALFPPLAAFAHYLWPEVLHLCLFLGALLLLSRSGGRPVRQGAVRLAAAGAVLAAATLTKSLLLPFVPVILLTVAIGESRSAGFGAQLDWRRPAWVVLGLCGVLLPAGVLAPGPASAPSAALFNLWLGWNDAGPAEDVGQIAQRAYLDYMASGEAPGDRDRVLRARLLEQMGEGDWPAAVVGQLRKQSTRFFDAESFLGVMLRGKSVHPEAAGYAKPPRPLAMLLTGTTAALYAVLLVGAVWGLAVARPSRGSWLWMAAAFLAYNLMLFFFVHVKSRYRIQCLPFLFVFAGVAVTWATARVGAMRGLPVRPGLESVIEPVGRLRLLIATGASALLLFLAFADLPAASVAVSATPAPDGALGPDALPMRTDELWADPNPIEVCSPATLGATTIRWKAIGETPESLFEVRAGAADGVLFARGVGIGSAATGLWVRDGMSFHLLATPGGDELAAIRVSVMRRECDSDAERGRGGDG